MIKNFDAIWGRLRATPTALSLVSLLTTHESAQANLGRELFFLGFVPDLSIAIDEGAVSTGGSRLTT